MASILNRFSVGQPIKKKKVISLVKSFSAVVSYLLVLFLIYTYNINYRVFVDLM